MREDPELDEALVERARAGDTDALNTLIRRHYEVAYRVALGVVRDTDLASDVVQDAFVKATRSLHTFRGDSAFRSWMMTIVKNEGLGALRRSGRRRESTLDAVAPLAAEGLGPAETAMLNDEASRARALIDRLPEKQRLAVTLRIDEDLSFREVGEVIGSTEGAARVNYHHGMTKLRSWMTEETR
ncbi:MAG: RNA polymerase sigma factor [Longimicrobiales bacterium]|nr:RNA polymerase sigma factor [Longimicrobiales bacterium]